MTHTVPTAAYRGAGRPEATYTIERLIDVAARELGIDPYELRRRNLIPPEAMPYKTALTFTYDCGEFEGNMQTAADLADLKGFPARREEAKRRGKLRGIGLCNCIEVAGGPFLRPAKDMSTLRLAEDGTLVLQSGSVSVGQGLETAFSQIVAERFGVPLEQVRYEQGDTDDLPYGKGNGGSGALCIGGSAVVAGGGRGDREGEADRSGAAGSGGGGCDVRGRPVQHRGDGPFGRSRDGGEGCVRSGAYPAGRGRWPGGER